MKLCDTCIYRNNVEQLKPCIIYRDDCEYYEKERGDMTRGEAILCLKGIKNYGRDTFTEQSDWQNSLDMAIEALEQEPCGDVISRQAVLDIIDSDWKYEGMEHYINELPPVNPQEPKTGHWKRISIDLYVQHAMAYYQCSECGEKVIGEHNYCQFCGARMESEEV